jgi:hypothetical protein
VLKFQRLNQNTVRKKDIYKFEEYVKSIRTDAKVIIKATLLAFFISVEAKQHVKEHTSHRT